MGNDKVDMVVIRVMGVVKISVASVEEGSLVFYIKSMDKAMNGGSFPPCHLNAVLVGICVNSRLWMYRNQWAYVDVRGGGYGVYALSLATKGEISTEVACKDSSVCWELGGGLLNIFLMLLELSIVALP